MSENIKASTGFEILLPKSVQALPVPCNEWDVLRSKIERLTTEPWLFHTIGSLLVGASLATLISIWTGSMSTHSTIIAWAVTTSSGLIGIACFAFAGKERKTHRERATDIVTQMSLIEQRFERAKT